MARVGVSATLIWAIAGCAVGEFIAGAPSKGERVAASGILARRCSGCHAIPDPKSMTGPQWHAALARMQRRIQLPASDWDSLATMGRRN